MHVPHLLIQCPVTYFAQGLSKGSLWIEAYGYPALDIFIDMNSVSQGKDLNKWIALA